MRPDGSEVTAEGKFYGEIGTEERGSNGFGYDSLFYVPELGMTNAEMTSEQKNAVSHRALALKELVEKLDRGE